MRFTNEVVKKEFSKIKNYLWIGVLLIVLSFVFLSLGDKRDSMDKKDALNMHNLIVDNLKDKELLPKLTKIINSLTNNFEEVKKLVKLGDIKTLDNMIYGVLKENK